MMGIGKNTTSKSMEAGSSTEGKYEDEAKHPAFFTLPVIAWHFAILMSLSGFLYGLVVGWALTLLFPVVGTEIAALSRAPLSTGLSAGREPT